MTVNSADVSGGAGLSMNVETAIVSNGTFLGGGVKGSAIIAFNVYQV